MSHSYRLALCVCFPVLRTPLPRQILLRLPPTTTSERSRITSTCEYICSKNHQLKKLYPLRTSSLSYTFDLLVLIFRIYSKTPSLPTKGTEIKQTWIQIFPNNCKYSLLRKESAINHLFSTSTIACFYRSSPLDLIPLMYQGTLPTYQEYNKRIDINGERTIGNRRQENCLNNSSNILLLADSVLNPSESHTNEPRNQKVQQRRLSANTCRCP